MDARYEVNLLVFARLFGNNCREENARSHLCTVPRAAEGDRPPWRSSPGRCLCRPRQDGGHLQKRSHTGSRTVDLIRRLEGFATFRVENACGFGFPKKAIELMLSGLREGVLHSTFFPQMRSMGLDPCEMAKRTYRLDLDTGAINRNTHDDGRGVYLMRAILECDDSGLLTEIRRRFEANGWQSALKKGQQLAEMVMAGPISTPDQSMAVWMKCAETLLGDVYSFTFSVEDVVKGPRTHKRAVITVSPANE